MTQTRRGPQSEQRWLATEPLDQFAQQTHQAATSSIVPPALDALDQPSYDNSLAQHMSKTRSVAATAHQVAPATSRPHQFTTTFSDLFRPLYPTAIAPVQYTANELPAQSPASNERASKAPKVATEKDVESSWESLLGAALIGQLSGWREYAVRGMGETGARLFVLAQTMNLLAEEAQNLRVRLPTTILTTQQHRILSLLARRFSTTEIAEQLGVSRSTIESHLKHARLKLGVATRKDLLMLVRAEGLL